MASITLQELSLRKMEVTQTDRDKGMTLIFLELNEHHYILTLLARYRPVQASYSTQTPTTHHTKHINTQYGTS